MFSFYDSLRGLEYFMFSFLTTLAAFSSENLFGETKESDFLPAVC